MTKSEQIPRQEQKRQPGREYKMQPEPEFIRKGYKGSGKLKDKSALITGGDSGIGRSVAVHFAREGADVAIVYLEEDRDAQETREMIVAEGRRCLLIHGDIQDREFCNDLVNRTMEAFGNLDILVNNAAIQFPHDNIENINDHDLDRTFETNIKAMFRICRAASPHLKNGARIINTASVTAYRGSDHLLDYSSTKGAITSFTRSLAKNFAKKGVLVNGVAPGPIWTPLIPSSFEPDQVEKFGQNTPLGRPGQPSEAGPAYVFLASDDATYITGQMLHINGGEVVGG